MLSKLLKDKNKITKFSLDYTSKILLIRHGESVFNYEIHNLNKLKEDNTFEELRNHVKFTDRLFDSDLTETGLKQAKNAGETLKHYNFKYIFVSPLLRALKTCSTILNQIELSNRNNNFYTKPIVIVHPFLYEKIEDNCDFFYTDFKLKRSHFNFYDWSLFDDIKDLPYYFLRFCDNYVNDEGILCKTEVDTESKMIDLNNNYYCHLFARNLQDINIHNMGKLFLQEIKKLDKFDTWIESSESTFERNKIFNKTLKEYASKLRENEKILVVGHSIFFKHLTLSEYKNEEFSTENYAYLKNCEIVSYYL